jgi:uncharacterized protein YoxC
MTNFWIVVIRVSSLAVDIVLILLLVQVLRTVMSLRKVFEELDPVLRDLQNVMVNVREMSDNAKGVAEDVREFSSSIREVGKTVQAVNDLAGSVGSSATVRAISLKAGIVAGLQYFLTNLIRKGDGK